MKEIMKKKNIKNPNELLRQSTSSHELFKHYIHIIKSHNKSFNVAKKYDFIIAAFLSSSSQ